MFSRQSELNDLYVMAGRLRTGETTRETRRHHERRIEAGPEKNVSALHLFSPFAPETSEIVMQEVGQSIFSPARNINPLKGRSWSN